MNPEKVSNGDSSSEERPVLDLLDILTPPSPLKISIDVEFESQATSSLLGASGCVLPIRDSAPKYTYAQVTEMFDRLLSRL
jgi:hypothetical protein